MAIASSGWHDGGDKLEFTVKNVNETKVGSVDVAIEWFDNGGRYLGQTSRRLAGIGPEDVVHARRTVDAVRGVRLRITTRSRLLPSWTPDAFSLDVWESGVEGVKGVLKNTTNEVRGATVIGIGYDGESVGYTGVASASGSRRSPSGGSMRRSRAYHHSTSSWTTSASSSSSPISRRSRA